MEAENENLAVGANKEKNGGGSVEKSRNTSIV